MKFRNIFAMCMTVVMSVVCCNMTFAQTQYKSIDIGVETVNIDQKAKEATVNIYLTNNSGIAKVGFDVEYDTKYLKLSSVENGEIFENKDLNYGDIDKSPLAIKYVHTGKGYVPDNSIFNSKIYTNVNMDGTLLKLKFEINEYAKGKYPINITTNSFSGAYDFNGQVVKMNISNGAIVVKQSISEATTEMTTISNNTSKINKGVGSYTIINNDEEDTTVKDTFNIKNEDDNNKISVTVGSNMANFGGRSVELDTVPFIDNGSVLVPLRFVAESVGNSNINWDSDTKTVSIEYNGKVIQFTNGSNIMVNGGKNVTMSNNVTAKIVDDKMYVPFRALGNALGVDVDWDFTTQTAIYTIK